MHNYWIFGFYHLQSFTAMFVLAISDLTQYVFISTDLAVRVDSYKGLGGGRSSGNPAGGRPPSSTTST